MKNLFKNAVFSLVAATLSFGTAVIARADVDPDMAMNNEPAAQVQSPAPAYEPPAAPAVQTQPQAQTASGGTSYVPQQTSQGTGATVKDYVNFGLPNNDTDAELQKKFGWWPSDATPGPVKDENRRGYWWWPNNPGKSRPWGNQGYIYVIKLIYDYKETPGPVKPSLVIKKIIKDVRVYFDYDKADLRDDAVDALTSAMGTLNRNPNADILITGNADVRGSEQYNEKLGERRGAAVERFLLDKGLPADRIKILSRGKLDAIASKQDLVGMQKDRNAHFVIAEVEEVNIPADQAHLYQDKVIEETKSYQGEIKVSTKEYTIQKGDTLWAIAEREYGNGRQWKRIYEFNKDVIANPDRPKKGTKIQIPIE